MSEKRSQLLCFSFTSFHICRITNRRYELTIQHLINLPTVPPLHWRYTRCRVWRGKGRVRETSCPLPVVSAWPGSGAENHDQYPELRQSPTPSTGHQINYSNQNTIIIHYIQHEMLGKVMKIPYRLDLPMCIQ